MSKKINRLRRFLGLMLIMVFAGACASAQEAERRAPDVIYVPTSQEVVNAMLKMAKVTKTDMVYDLGSGDGRIVITAAKEYGATGIGVDIDPERIKEANENARKANVNDKVKFIEGDLFKMNFKDATVVTLYLLPSLNLKLRPQLFEQLKPGTRVVSHSFDMGDWEPEQKLTVNGSNIYMWTIPEKKPPKKSNIFRSYAVERKMKK